MRPSDINEVDKTDDDSQAMGSEQTLPFTTDVPNTTGLTPDVSTDPNNQT